MKSRLDFILADKKNLSKIEGPILDASKSFKEIGALIKTGYDCDMRFNPAKLSFEITCSNSDKGDYVEYLIPRDVFLGTLLKPNMTPEAIDSIIGDYMEYNNKMREQGKEFMSFVLKRILGADMMREMIAKSKKK